MHGGTQKAQCAGILKKHALIINLKSILAENFIDTPASKIYFFIMQKFTSQKLHFKSSK